MCKNYKFLDTLKYADITQLFKKGDTTEKRNIDLLVPILLSQKYLKNWLSLSKLSKLSKKASLKTVILDMPFKEWLKHWDLSKGNDKVGEIAMNISKAFDAQFSNPGA